MPQMCPHSETHQTTVYLVNRTTNRVIPSSPKLNIGIGDQGAGISPVVVTIPAAGRAVLPLLSPLPTRALPDPVSSPALRTTANLPPDQPWGPQPQPAALMLPVLQPHPPPQPARHLTPAPTRQMPAQPASRPNSGSARGATPPLAPRATRKTRRETED